MFSDNLLEKENTGTYLVRPSSSFPKAFVLEIKGEFHIKTFYIKRAKSGWYYATETDGTFLKIVGPTLPIIMEQMKKYLHETPFRLLRPCPKIFFFRIGNFKTYTFNNKDLKNELQQLSGYVADLDLTKMASDSVLLATVGNNRQRFCLMFEETKYSRELFNVEGLSITELGSR